MYTSINIFEYEYILHLYTYLDIPPKTTTPKNVTLLTENQTEGFGFKHASQSANLLTAHQKKAVPPGKTVQTKTKFKSLLNFTEAQLV